MVRWLQNVSLLACGALVAEHRWLAAAGLIIVYALVTSAEYHDKQSQPRKTHDYERHSQPRPYNREVEDELDWYN